MGFVEFICLDRKRNKEFQISVRPSDVLFVVEVDEEYTILVFEQMKRKKRKGHLQITVKGCFREVMEKLDPWKWEELNRNDPLYQKRLRHPETPRQDAQER